MAKGSKTAKKSDQETKRKVGRPTKFNEDLTTKILEWAKKGKTNEEIAELTGIAVSTLGLWRRENPEFMVALKESKDAADGIVEASLFQNAVIGNVTAQIFWLKNRRPNEWREKQEVAHTDADGNPVQVIISLPSNGRESKND